MEDVWSSGDLSSPHTQQPLSSCSPWLSLCSKCFVGTSHVPVWVPLSSSVKGQRYTEVPYVLPAHKHSSPPHRGCLVRGEGWAWPDHSGCRALEAAVPLGFTGRSLLVTPGPQSCSFGGACPCLFYPHFASFLFQTCKVDL